MLCAGLPPAALDGGLVVPITMAAQTSKRYADDRCSGDRGKLRESNVMPAMLAVFDVL